MPPEGSVVARGMIMLADVVKAVEGFNLAVEREVERARTDTDFGKDLLEKWRTIRAGIAHTTTPTGLKLPRLALPQVDEPGEIARHLLGEGLPGEFPFTNGAYPQMYLGSADGNGHAAKSEEPTRLFAGLGLTEDTNARFHYLTGHQRSARLSTAFDGPTLYGLDSDADGVLGKVGAGGVAIDTVEDMERLYAGFELGGGRVSAAMTINGP